MAQKQFSVKLLIDTKTNKVLFAEGGKDFVDFLFRILSLPVGAVVRLLKKGTMTGSLGNLYDSIENLSNDYIQQTFHKDSLLKPSFPPRYDGYVMEKVTYMIMDDLVVKPMSTISGITLLNRFSIKDVSSLEEKVVHLGLGEGMAALWKASFESNTVLTDVFLAKKASM
ncbi:hypothetical protein Ancab_015023 [Ancistrocladus abbreviatus]